MTPVERAVAAMKRSVAWSSFWSDDDMAVLARAALSAVAEPTEDMIDAGWLTGDCWDDLTGRTPGDVWTAMHQKMMEEGKANER